MFHQVFLDYSFNSLEPYIDTLTMETHYLKHHATYTKNFNEIVKKIPAFHDKSAEYILSHIGEAPPELREGLRNQGGGYLAHNLYFSSLSPHDGGIPEGMLASKINEDFGSFDEMKKQLSAAANTVFGSGYAWLVLDGDGHIVVEKTANQDLPIMAGNPNMLLPIDVWEHAYYLKHKNLRADYVEAVFNVIDWNKVAERLEVAIRL